MASGGEAAVVAAAVVVVVVVVVAGRQHGFAGAFLVVLKALVHGMAGFSGSGIARLSASRAG